MLSGGNREKAVTSIHVCSLALVERTIAETSATRLVTCMRSPAVPRPPASIEAHLVLEMDDIDAPACGMVAPQMQHVESLVAFVRDWDRQAPLVVHCHAGISRSTAAAFVALCALNPEHEERGIAQRLRAASAAAWPNALLVAHGDRVLGRRNRMRRAIAAIGPGHLGATCGWFTLPAAIS